MSVFKRGGVYCYEFEFMGQRVRESAHTRNKERARSIEGARRKAMEESAGGVKRLKPLLFRKAAKTWLAGNAHWSESYREINTLKLSHLLPVFGNKLLTEINDTDHRRGIQDTWRGRPSYPLNDEAFEILVEWHAKLDQPKPSHYIFPSERYGFAGHNSHLTGAVATYALDPNRPMGSWKTAWTACRKAAGVSCRLHDLRHTFISALGEAGVPESTMKALAGWMSAKMLERYSHTRNEAKSDAVKTLPWRRPR